MNATVPDPALNHLYHILLGSNIEPLKNITLAIRLLNQKLEICAISSVWETEAVGSTNSPNFLNVAVSARSPFSLEELRKSVLYVIEDQLGRVRTNDKYAPRTIDLDVILVDGAIVDPKLWSHAFIAIPISELIPDLMNQSNETLVNIAERLRSQFHAVARTDVLIKKS